MLRAVALLIGEIFRRNAAAAPGELAAALGERALSHAELDAAGNRTAQALRAQGVRHGDRVVTWADTSLDVLPLFVALARLGAVFAPLNARLGAAEAVEVVRMARPAWLVADPERAAAGEQLARAAGVPRLARLGGSGPGLDLVAAAADAPADEPQEPALRETDPHVIFFTSGSTGRSKGVILSHRANYLRSFQGVFLDVPERTVCMFPLFHMAAFTLALAAWQTRGAILFAQPTAESLLSTAERRRANRLYCIPAVWGRVLEADLDHFDLSSVRIADTGTSATPIELIRALKQRFPGTVTRIFYGSTEAGSGALLADADVLRKPGSVGRPPPGVDLRLTPAGEICLRSDYLMDGYFENPQATAEALREGWYHTGDLGALDGEGYLSIVGRVRDIIRTGGESVAPAEVETALADHPGIAEVAVVGIPDPAWGEIVCAVVVPRDGARIALEELQAHCAGRLARFKQPRRLELFGALPRTPATRQVQRALIVEQIATRAARA
jgi:acyl-CoA synthetase (AMP-forming)/AMP-acid ligase II